MLDSDQPERTEDTTGGTPDAAPAAPPAPPVVTRRTRKSPAKKAAAPAASVEVPTAAPEAAPVATDEAPAKKAIARKAPAKKAAAKRAPAKKAAAAEVSVTDEATGETTDEAIGEPAEVAPVKKTTARRGAAKAPAKRTTARKGTAAQAAPAPEQSDASTEQAAPAGETGHAVLFQAPVATTTRRTRKRVEPVVEEPVVDDVVEELADEEEDDEAVEAAAVEEAPRTRPARKRSASKRSGGTQGAAAPDEADQAPRVDAVTDEQSDEDESQDLSAQDEESGDADGGPARRRRRRGGRRRRKSSDGSEAADGSDTSDAEGDEPAGAPSDQTAASDEGAAGSDESTDDESGTDESADSTGEGTGEGSSRRRRRRRRSGDEGGSDDGDTPTVTRVRKARSAEDQITAVAGSTRLEAKKQRRREGREAGRRRAPIVSEAEFLARRESVERVMVIRQREELTQIGVLEDKVLVEHYVARESQTSLIGNVYLGRVQNVLPSMEAAFIDIGKGRNAVLYAGEVNWSSLGHKEGQARKIESVLSSGQMILVQVTKDPIGQKGARLTSQISLAGRFLVYVPDGTTSGISRKLPDTERNRLKALLKELVPDTAGVIVRTAAEGASEEELTHDVERLTSRWEDIEKKSAHKGSGPQMLYGEPDLTLKVVRDLFTEDFSKLVIEGEDAWDTVRGYVESVAPDLIDRVQRFERGKTGGDIFATYRVDEQIHKGLDRKVWLPSGGSLVIDRTEAMTVVDVNTGKFVGSGGNLEETVTKNNIEAAEEIVRQLRLRDIGGIIVIDFIDMVLESNRDLVVRRLLECLGRDRTKHQVAEVTSLGLVQMTRKRVGGGLIEVFSTTCEHCNGRGIIISADPVDQPAGSDGSSSGSTSSSGSGGTSGGGDAGGGRGTRGRRAGGSGRDTGVAVAPEPKGTPDGPTPAQIAASAHAAAIHAASRPEPAAPYLSEGDEQVAAQVAEQLADLSLDVPVEVVSAPAPAKSKRRSRSAKSPAVSVESVVVEPVAVEPVAVEAVLEPSAPQSFEPSVTADEPVPMAEVSAEVTEATAPAPRGRRKRARVVAPAGPPPGVDDGAVSGEFGSSAPEQVV